MVDLAKLAEARLDEIKKRARAHEASAENHRHRDAQLTSAARMLSAIVGTGVFVGLVSKLGFDGKGSLSIPPGWEWMYWSVLALSLVAPALAAFQIARHDADDATKHLECFSEYQRLADDMEIFLSRGAQDPAAAESTYLAFSERYQKLLPRISLAEDARKLVGL